MPFKSFQEYRDQWDKAFRKDPPIPLNIDIELSSLCNLACPFCFIADPEFDKGIKESKYQGISKRRFMDLNLVRKIINESAAIGVPALKFNWRGESTLHPNFSEILNHASTITHSNGVDKRRPAFFELLINTNGNCPYTAINGLMKCTKIMISLDSMNPETYRKMRVKGNLLTAKKTINELIVKGHPNIWVRRVITKENKNEDFMDVVKKEWGNRVKASEHYCFDRNHHGDGEHGEYMGADLGRQYCGYPSQRLIISSSGLVYPCCIDTHETMPVGDFNKQSLLEIWNGDKMRDLRKELRQGTFNSNICDGCTSWMSYQSPKREFVQDREEKSNAKISPS